MSVPSIQAPSLEDLLAEILEGYHPQGAKGTQPRDGTQPSRLVPLEAIEVPTAAFAEDLLPYQEECRLIEYYEQGPRAATEPHLPWEGSEWLKGYSTVLGARSQGLLDGVSVATQLSLILAQAEGLALDKLTNRDKGPYPKILLMLWGRPDVYMATSLVRGARALVGSVLDRRLPDGYLLETALGLDGAWLGPGDAYANLLRLGSLTMAVQMTGVNHLILSAHAGEMTPQEKRTLEQLPRVLVEESRIEQSARPILSGAYWPTLLTAKLMQAVQERTQHMGVDATALDEFLQGRGPAPSVVALQIQQDRAVLEEARASGALPWIGETHFSHTALTRPGPSA